jgi:hypothetical protein
MVGDNPHSFSLSRQVLERSGSECHFAGSLDAAQDLLQLWQFDIVLSVLSLRILPRDIIQGLVGLLSDPGVCLFLSLSALKTAPGGCFYRNRHVCTTLRPSSMTSGNKSGMRHTRHTDLEIRSKASTGSFRILEKQKHDQKEEDKWHC